MDLSTHRRLKDEVPTLKNYFFETSDINFKRVKGHMTFLHPGIDLSPMDMFNVFHGGNIMTNTQSYGHVASPILDG